MAVKVQFDADVTQAVANIKQLNRTARDASRHAGSLSSRLGGVFSSLKGALAGVAAFTGFAVSIGAVKRAIDDMDNTAKQARALNMTGEELQVLQYAAQSANLPLEAVTNVLPNYGVLELSSDFGTDVMLELQVRREVLDALKAELTELSAGRIVMEEGTPGFADFALVGKDF